MKYYLIGSAFFVSLIILWLIFIISASSNELHYTGDFPFKFDKIDAVFYLPKYHDDDLVFDDGRINNPIQIITVKESHYQIIKDAILINHDDSQVHAACYNPRHGLVFYDKGKIVAWFEYCLSCNGWGYSDSFNFKSKRIASLDMIRKLNESIGLIMFQDESLYNSIIGNPNIYYHKSL